jgi:hypothetical protein
VDGYFVVNMVVCIKKRKDRDFPFSENVNEFFCFVLASALHRRAIKFGNPHWLSGASALTSWTNCGPAHGGYVEYSRPYQRLYMQYGTVPRDTW